MLKTNQMFYVHTTSEEFKNVTITVYLLLRKTHTGEWHYYHNTIVFETEFRFQNLLHSGKLFRSEERFPRLRFRGRLAGETVEI